MKIEQIDHICVAVRDLEQAVRAWERALGIQVAERYQEGAEKINVARFYFGNVAFELMESTSPDGEVAKFVERKGEGLYLLSLRVDDVDNAVAELKTKGVRLIDQEPRRGGGAVYAFAHPRAFTGVLVEIFRQT